MPAYSVYHAVSPTFDESVSFHGPIDERYERVAVVLADSLDEVYGRTQNIDKPWLQNPGVLSSEMQARSTSVGDVLMVTENGSRDAYRVAPMGFTKLDWRQL